jgi:DNA modification methylase
MAEPEYATLPRATLLEMSADYNPRTIGSAELAALERSLATFGFVQPVIVNRRSGKIVGGHQRVKAAPDGPLPVVYVDLDEHGERQLNLALNKISGAWDDAKLRALLGDLSAEGADLSLTGFSEDELRALLAKSTEGLTDPDEAPAVGESTDTAAGVWWELGAHRLVCGDSTDVAVLEKLMDGYRADLVLTDPPYGVGYSGTATKERAEIANDGTDPSTTLRAAFHGARVVSKPGSAFYAFYADRASRVELDAALDAGWRVAQICIWAKHHFVLSRAGDYHVQHEPCLYGWNPDASHRWYGDRKQSTLWQFDRPMKSDLHPTMKPIALLEYLLGNSSRGGDLVLDPFGGSGSTLIACEKTGRACRMVELDPRYCDVIVKRWQDFTGQQAVRHA